MARGIRKAIVNNNPKLRNMRFKVPVTSAIKALLVVQDITYTSVLRGIGGNSYSIEYTDTASAGAETVVVTAGAIVIGIESGVSTATQVKTAFDAESDATDIVSAAITGTAGDPQATAAAVNLATGTNIAVTGLDASQITSVTESAVGTWLVILKYAYIPAGEPDPLVSTQTPGANPYVFAVDHDRVTVKAVDVTDGTTAIDCNFMLDVLGNDGKLTY